MKKRATGKPARRSARTTRRLHPSVELIAKDLARTNAAERRVNEVAAKTLLPPLTAADPADAARLRTYHRGVDVLTKHVRHETSGQSVMDHHIVFTADHLHDIFKDTALFQTWPKLSVIGKSSYSAQWIDKISIPGVPSADNRQTVLSQSASVALANGTMHVDHRVSNGASAVRAGIGFEFIPSVIVGKIKVRPYLLYKAQGFVSVDWSTGWVDGYEKARAEQCAEIYVASSNLAGSDYRYEGPVRVTATRHVMPPGGFGTFNDDGVLTVLDGLELEAWVVNTRRYMIWIVCEGFARSKILPERASSQAFAVLDYSVPWVVVEESPVP